jgi:hypothetical protein
MNVGRVLRRFTMFVMVGSVLGLAPMTDLGAQDVAVRFDPLTARLGAPEGAVATRELVPSGRVSNLVGLDRSTHSQVSAAWGSWKAGLGGATPTQAQIMQQALAIDRRFGSSMVFLP